MVKTLVLGASGGMGYSIVKELSSRGIAVTAFARTRNKLEKLFAKDPNVTIYAGDVFKMEDLQAAARGVDIIFQSANIPYQEWDQNLPTLMGNIIKTAQDQSAKLAIIDNIYAYGRSAGKKVNETTPKVPHTRKGKIRLQLEKTVKQSGVPAVIAHFPDFYGPNAENTILQYTLQNVVKNKKSMFVGDKSIAREFIFTPDGAKAIVNLALNDQAYGQNWNIPGYDVITGKELIKTIRQLTGYEKGVSTVTKNMIRLLGLFNSGMREVVEMYYLNEEPVVLNGEKYEKQIGPLPRTPYREGLKQTLAHMKN
ncbi:SDR family NAD(P)-dependent oxidoreductase [Bacillus sp. T33-2]|uniref:SDR family NAD(P)-dependent oxidoreductase n=1 Tax=Bacillus sp. T33-2 TaxID=2054168 RepID=UPI000C757E8A|nr:SDR family NAD(P)-dependent oxidoreductase [Bacillus sp. T33-2]PLR97553.1 short chain dehydrogenase [Bacillus sp. T33-2]